MVLTCPQYIIGHIIYWLYTLLKHKASVKPWDIWLQMSKRLPSPSTQEPNTVSAYSLFTSLFYFIHYLFIIAHLLDGFGMEQNRVLKGFCVTTVLEFTLPAANNLCLSWLLAMSFEKPLKIYSCCKNPQIFLGTPRQLDSGQCGKKPLSGI